MIVPWDHVRLIELPLERLRFERDPFDLANDDSHRPEPCPCQGCRWKRGIKAAMQTAVSDEALSGATQTVQKYAPAALEPAPVTTNMPHGTAAGLEHRPNQPASALLLTADSGSPPSITGFDVQSAAAPESPLSAQENDDDEGYVDLPPSLVWFCEMVDRLCRWMAGMFYVAVLAPRAERRRLLSVYFGEDAQ